MPLKPNSYPPPPPFTYPIPPTHPILPIYPPPPPLPSESLPPLPSAPRVPAFLNTPQYRYELSTHLVPASYLRTTRHVPLPQLPPALGPGAKPEEKEARKKKLMETREMLDDVRGSKSTDGYPRVLWNCVNQYVRVGPRSSPGKKGLTLFFAHANGFPKEIFEPTISQLISSEVRDIVDEIWVWESIQHGDAALVNGANLSVLFDWHDNARDILNFLLYFLPSSSASSQPEQLPTHLPKISEDITRQRLSKGFTGTDERRLVAVGHSYGGCTSALAATIHPALFTALYLVDPVIIEPRYAFSESKERNTEAYRIERSKRPDLAMGALSRRNGWASREQAHAAFLSNPFFAAWDPEVLKIYVECGLHSPSPVPSSTTQQQQKQSPITLKTPPILEASVFAEIHTEHEVFHLLSSLPPNVSLRWCMPGKPGAPQLGYGPLGPSSSEDEKREVEEGIARRVWVRRGTGKKGGEETTTNVSVSGGGHLIPQEAPKELAEDLAAYLSYMYPRWNRPRSDAKSVRVPATSRVTLDPSSSSSLKANL